MPPPERDPARPGRLLAPAKILAVAWCVAALALAGVVLLGTHLSGGARTDNTAVVKALSLNTLAAAPSGSALRFPRGTHPGVAETHAPGVPRALPAATPADTERTGP